MGGLLHLVQRAVHGRDAALGGAHVPLTKVFRRLMAQLNVKPC